MSCLTSDDEAHEQVMSLKQNSVKQRHSVRSGMMDNLGRKQEDSDAGCSLTCLVNLYRCDILLLQTSVHQFQAIQRMMLTRTKLP